MALFFIKKAVEADSIAEAIQRERKARITDVWTDKIDVTAIGFRTRTEYDDELERSDVARHV